MGFGFCHDGEKYSDYLPLRTAMDPSSTTILSPRVEVSRSSPNDGQRNLTQTLELVSNPHFAVLRSCKYSRLTTLTTMLPKIEFAQVKGTVIQETGFVDRLREGDDGYLTFLCDFGAVGTFCLSA